jgi:aldose sugar dehydrogenase
MQRTSFRFRPTVRMVLAALLALGLAAGLAILGDKLWIDRYIKGELPDTLRFSSVFVPLLGKVVPVPPPDREGTGGGLTSWRGYLVLLTHEGKIYFVDAEHHLAQSRIAAPFNGFDDYVAVASKPPFDTFEHRFEYFRYNDIVSFTEGDREGFIVSYTKYDKTNACYTTTLSRLYIDEVSDVVTDPVLANRWTDIYQTQPCLPLKSQWRAIEGHMAGGRMAFDGKRTVYLASGDYAWDGIYGPRTIPTTDTDTGAAVAQDPAADYGKVIAVDVATGQARQISRGQRNTQGIALDRAGRVWTVEHGPRGGDELNLIIEGHNYGWPLESYGTLYSALPLPNTLSLGRHQHFQRPMLAWLPSIAVSGLTRIEGFHEAWDGDLLAASLRGQQLARIRVADDRVIFSEVIDVGRRVRSIHQHSNGEIVLWTNKYELVFLSPAAGGLGMRFADDHLRNMKASASVVGKVRSALQACMECHSLDANDSTNAPSLARVFGSKTGSTAFRNYSEALISDERTWTNELLIQFLKEPAAIIPGTTMPNPNIRDARVREGIVTLLKGLATTVEVPIDR